MQTLLKKLAQRNLVGVTVSSEKVILVSRCPRPAKKRSPFLRQNFMEKLAHRNLPCLSPKLMKKLAQRNLVGVTVSSEKEILVSRPRGRLKNSHHFWWK